MPVLERNAAEVVAAIARNPQFGPIVRQRIETTGAIARMAENVRLVNGRYETVEMGDFEAHFINYGDRKPVSGVTLSRFAFDAKPLVVLTVMGKYVQRDIAQFTARLTQKLGEAFARAMDREFLTNSDGKFTQGVIQAARVSGSTLVSGADLYADLNRLLGMIEQKGYDPNGFVTRLAEREGLRAVRAGGSGAPIFAESARVGEPGTLLGRPHYATTVLKSTAAVSETRIVAGAWSNLQYGIQDTLEVETFTAGIVTVDGVQRNLIEENLIAIRAEMRAGFDIADPAAFSELAEPAT
jgi:HK97 family phage major capsid protein